jgi:2-oxoisovalerate dehydrogenase E1 component
MQDRADIVHQNFLTRVAEQSLPAGSKITLAESGLSPAQCVEIFESQVLSRQLDNISRKLQARGQGFYTIGSSGHEGNAAISAAFRVNDMAFLHYRSAAFFIQRSKMQDGQTPLWDMLLSFVASSEDPISGGRHKVLGSKSLFIPPQTSTIASHLPKAVGAAFSIGQNKRLDQEGVLAEDGVVLCSFGDASLNHSTAQGAINTSGWTAYQNLELPLVFICEDNGLGISTMTPRGWVEASMKAHPTIKYMPCNGFDILNTYKVAREVEEYVRIKRKPVFLHMRCTRLFGHAGPDVQNSYLNKDEIARMEADDPLLYTARNLIENNVLNAGQILDLYNGIGERCARAAEEVIKRPKLKTAQEIEKGIIPPQRDVLQSSFPDMKHREDVFAEDWKLMEQAQHMARLINWTLHDLMLEYSNIVLAGEDIGPKGGVYTVTKNLHARFGGHRVINTLLDEQSILGLGIGMAHNNILPIPEIQFLAYLHNAEDQLRGEASTLSFFSQGQYTNPMVVRIAGLGYQKGFGGHFHNDNAIAVLRDLPGVIVACPSNGADAPALLRECVRLAQEEQRVVVFLEPIALYMTRDLHESGDGLWTASYNHEARIGFGDIGQFGEGTDLCILTYGNGYYLSRQAAKTLEDKGINIRVIDLRWLHPLPEEAILDAVKGCEHILIVDECRKSGSPSEEIISLLHEKLSEQPKMARVTATDCFIPLGPASAATLPSRDDIIEATLDLMGRA